MKRLERKNAAKLAFGGISYKGSVQQIHNDQLFFASSYPNQETILYGDQQPPSGSLRVEAGNNVICNAIAWATPIGEQEWTCRGLMPLL